MHTHRLDKDTDLLKLGGTAFGTRRDAAVAGYLRLPISAPNGPLPNTSWLLLLELTGKNQGLLPFDIAGDVVVGRGADGPDAPDLDLTALQAFENGISRRHAMLRPTTNHLYLIDLGSTNGTTVNGLLTGKGAVPLRRHDHVTIGQLNMRVLQLERVTGTLESPANPTPAPAGVVVQITEPPKPPMPTPPLDVRMPAIQKPDPTLPLPAVVDTLSAEKSEGVKDEKPVEASPKPAEPAPVVTEAAPSLESKPEAATAPTAPAAPPAAPPPVIIAAAPKSEPTQEQTSQTGDLPPLEIEERKTIEFHRKLDSQTS